MMDLDSISRFRLYLNPIVSKYESASFIQDDPISIPHAFDDPIDQEVIGLFSSMLAWGRRDVMLRKLEELCDRMSYRPAAFVHSYKSGRDRGRLEGFVHRTFNEGDLDGILVSLKKLLNGGTVEQAFLSGMDSSDPVRSGIQSFSDRMLGGVPGQPARIRQHIARPSRGSACKRMNMYLRWMVRNGPVDMGIWDILDPSDLKLPLDVHSGTQARAIGLLERKSNDWKAVEDLTLNCMALDPADPCKYDFALFGAGSAGETLNLDTES